MLWWNKKYGELRTQSLWLNTDQILDPWLAFSTLYLGMHMILPPPSLLVFLVPDSVFQMTLTCNIKVNYTNWVPDSEWIRAPNLRFMSNIDLLNNSYSVYNYYESLSLSTLWTVSKVDVTSTGSYQPWCLTKTELSYTLCQFLYCFHVAIKVTFYASGSTCIASRLHITSNRTQSGSCQVGNKARKLHHDVVFSISS